MDASSSTDGNGKRNRKPKTFAGYVTETNEDYFQETEQQGHGPRAAAADHQQPQPKRRRSTSSVSATSTPRRQQQQQSSSSSSGTTAQPAGGGSVKKVAGVQNATRRALEWLQFGDLSIAELTQSLPKLSKARVEIVMEALRAAGLVTLVRKHAPDATGEDHVTEVYRFSAGRSAAEALEIGGGKPVTLGSISKRIKTSQAELTGLNERINVLKEAAKSDPGPEQVQEMLRQFIKQDKSLEEDPFYSVAYKATCTATSKAAAAARAAALAQAKKKAAEDAAVAAAALSAAAETKRRADELAREQQAAALQARRISEESKRVAAEAAESRTIPTINEASAASTAATAAAAAFSAAAFSGALAGTSAATSISSVVSAASSSSLPAVETRTAPATPAPSSPPAVATAVAESTAPFVGELGGLVVSGMISPHSIPPPPPPPGGQP